MLPPAVGMLTGPLNEEGERDPSRGLLVLVVIDTTTMISACIHVTGAS